MPQPAPSVPRYAHGRAPCNGMAVALVCLLSACGARTPAAEAPVDPETAAKVVVVGTGKLCTTDKDCGAVPSPGLNERGACVLGTCFGLLTTESATVRAVLADRVAAAPPAVRKVSQRLLLRALHHHTSGQAARLGAVRGLGALQHATAPCEEACQALRGVAGESDEALAVAARLALARRADPKVLPTLLGDTREGTEHLRCSATRALGTYLAAGVFDDVVVPTLLARLSDRAPGVRRAAAEVLAPWRSREGVAKALDAAAARFPADLRYVVARRAPTGGAQ